MFQLDHTFPVLTQLFRYQTEQRETLHMSIGALVISIKVWLLLDLGDCHIAYEISCFTFISIGERISHDKDFRKRMANMWIRESCLLARSGCLPMKSSVIAEKRRKPRFGNKSCSEQPKNLIGVKNRISICLAMNFLVPSKKLGRNSKLKLRFPQIRDFSF